MSVFVKPSIEENEFSSIKIPHCSGALLTLQLLLVTVKGKIICTSSKAK